MKTELPAWLQVAAVIISTVSGGFAIWALLSKRRLEHGKWLQEKRLEAYVELLSASRSVYEGISARAWDVVPGSATDETKASPHPFAKDERGPGIEQRLNTAKHAAAVIRLLGPTDVADLGAQLLARLRLDRLYYSPTRSKQLTESSAFVLELAEETGQPELVAGLQEVLRQQPIDERAYTAIHNRFRLDSFWDDFTTRASAVITSPRSSR